MRASEDPTAGGRHGLARARAKNGVDVRRRQRSGQLARRFDVADRKRALGAHITFGDTNATGTRHREGRAAQDQREDRERVNAHNKLHSTRLFVLSGARANLRGNVGLCAGLRCLVSARRSLYQSKPSNRGHERYHRGGRTQAEYPDPSATGWSTPVARQARRARDATSPTRPTPHPDERRRIGARPTTRRRHTGSDAVHL